MSNLKNIYINQEGKKYLFEYIETDSFENIDRKKCKQVIAFAFHDDKMILVNNVRRPKEFIPLGGSVEEGEDADESLIREIKEESNMKVLDFKPLGYQIVTDEDGRDEPYYQFRYYCKVEPYGPFVEDPDGDITEVLEIDPVDYKKYFDWGEIGDALMEKALRIKNNL
jgi:ADP-ribose pyrophosphatase YjhB (NUDIX family)